MEKLRKEKHTDNYLEQNGKWERSSVLFVYMLLHDEEWEWEWENGENNNNNNTISHRTHTDVNNHRHEGKWNENGIFLTPSSSSSSTLFYVIVCTLVFGSIVICNLYWAQGSPQCFCFSHS